MKDTYDKMKTMKAALIYLTKKIPEKNFSSLKQNFLMIDRGNSGKIDSETFIRCLSKANMKAGENEIKALVDDLNHA
jgi:Ca2+-binding EF-hand superfamily protein